MKNLLLACITVLLASCAPNTYDALKREHAGEMRFLAERPAVEVFALVRERAQKCHAGSTYSSMGVETSRIMVEGAADASGKGVITVTLYGAFGPDMHLAIEVLPLSENATEVTAVYALASWQKFAAAVEQWVKAGSTKCKFKV